MTTLGWAILIASLFSNAVWVVAWWLAQANAEFYGERYDRVMDEWEKTLKAWKDSTSALRLALPQLSKETRNMRSMN